MLKVNQTPNLTFKGILKDDKNLRKRISNDSRANMQKMYLALERMKNVDDGKTYRYVEKTIEGDIPGCYHFDSYASIIDESGETQKSTQIGSWDEFEGSKHASSNFISNLICDFVDDKYPSKDDKANLQNKIFDLLG